MHFIFRISKIIFKLVGYFGKHVFIYKLYDALLFIFNLSL